MKLYHALAALAGYQTAEAVICYSCTASFESTLGASDAGPGCWNPTNTAATGVTVTPTIGTTGTSGTGNCLTCTAQITLVDGFPKSITRACETTTQDANNFSYGAVTCSATAMDFSDYFTSSALVTDSDTTLEQSTTCKSDCTSDRCNSDFVVSDLTVCGQIDDYTQKWCDFTTGNWQCNSGYYPSGTESLGSTAIPGSTVPCQVTTTAVTDTFTAISCVQCNSMTDSTCFTKTTASSCNDETFQSCFAQSTITYDRHTGAMLKETVVKGCSTEAPASVGTITPDQCFWSDARVTRSGNGASDVFYTQKDTFTTSYDQGLELVCSSRCDPSVSSTCNSEVPNGQISSSEETIYCAVHDSDSTSGDVSQSYDFTGSLIACPAGTTGCYSTVTYMLRDDNAFLNQNFVGQEASNEARVRVTKQLRGCLSTSTPEVTENKCEQSTTFSAGTNITPGVTMTTCQESCVGNACNAYNWPNRHKCLRSGQTATQVQGAEAGSVVLPCRTPADDMCYIAEFNMVTPTSSYYINEAATDALRDAGTDLGFTTTAYRGCGIQSDRYTETGCDKQGVRGTGSQHKNQWFESCNFTCFNEGCNWGTAYSSSFLELASPLVMVVALVFKNL